MNAYEVKSPDWHRPVETWWACGKCGRVFMPINSLYPRAEAGACCTKIKDGDIMSHDQDKHLTSVEKPLGWREHEARSQEGFLVELTGLLNKYSRENGSNTPDFILANYLMDCLTNWNKAVETRERWYGRGPKPVEPPQSK